MTKHTPGPWRVTQAWSSLQYSKSFGVEAPTPEGPGHPTASATGYYAMALPPPHGVDTNSRAIQEANARLIAAAPDLLEALQRVMASDPVTASDTPGDGSIYDDARAAIAKALVKSAPAPKGWERVEAGLGG